MGCDIHAVFQRRVRDGWEEVKTEWDTGRHYFLFAWLADVRNSFGVVPIAPDRGLPPDFTMPDVLDGADHSFTWMMASEILSAELPHNAEHLEYFLKEIHRLKDEYGDVRLVCGFDN